MTQRTTSSVPLASSLLDRLVHVLPVALLTLPLAATAGCATNSAHAPDGVLAPFAGASSIEILALYPVILAPGLRELILEHNPGYVFPAPLDDPDASYESFHDYPILGRATISAPDRRNALIALIEDGIDASDGGAAMCFEPRHGIRLTLDGTVWDLVICFACNQIEIHRDGVEQEGHLTSNRFAADVTAIYVANGLTIAP